MTCHLKRRETALNEMPVQWYIVCYQYLQFHHVCTATRGNSLPWLHPTAHKAFFPPDRLLQVSTHASADRLIEAQYTDSMAQVYSAGPLLCLVREERTIQATEAVRCQFLITKRERNHKLSPQTNSPGRNASINIRLVYATLQLFDDL